MHEHSSLDENDCILEATGSGSHNFPSNSAFPTLNRYILIITPTR